eukprot:2718200-Rhodomonas_salina.1
MPDSSHKLARSLRVYHRQRPPSPLSSRAIGHLRAQLGSPSVMRFAAGTLARLHMQVGKF